MDQTTITNNISLKAIHSGNNDGVILELMVNNKRIYVSFLPSKAEPPNAIDNFITRFDTASERGHYTAEEDVLEEMQDLIFETGNEVLAMVAPPMLEAEVEGRIVDESSTRTDEEVEEEGKYDREGKNLSEVLFPETFSFEMEIVNDEAKLGREEKPCPFMNRGVALEVDIRKGDLERFSVEGLTHKKNLGKWGHDGWVSLVESRDGRIFCFKGEKFDERILKRELGCLRYVATKAPELRVPRTLGLVEKVNGGVCGILMAYIRTADGGDTLENIVKRGGVSGDRKKKWMTQIRETVEGLHKINVVWGDAKPRNILIEERSDDIWLVDFGGLYTNGWVDAGVMETVEGDKQALGGIAVFLGVE